jgi:hypothetical protein
LIRAGGEINQSVNVGIAATRGFERDNNGNIVSFFARDKSGEEVKVNLREPASAEIMNAEVVELLGHMHSDVFIAVRASVVK